MDHVPATDPYPWPYDGDLDGARLALVVAGAQAHWLARSTTPTEVLAELTGLAAAVRERGGLVVAVRHGRDPALAERARRPHLPVVGTDGWALCLGALEPEHVVDAAGVDGFARSPLDALLDGLGRDRLLLGGFCSEITVDSTLRSANDRGHECLVVADACAPADSVLGRHALSSVTMSGGIFGAVGSAAAVREALGAPRPRLATSTTTDPTTPTHPAPLGGGRPQEDR